MTDPTRRLAEAILSSDEDDDAYSSASGAKDARIKRRMALSRAITLIESRTDTHRKQADLLLNYLLRHSNTDEMKGQSNPSSFRVGIAGPPGERCKISYMIHDEISCVDVSARKVTLSNDSLWPSSPITFIFYYFLLFLLFSGAGKVGERCKRSYMIHDEISCVDVSARKVTLSNDSLWPSSPITFIFYYSHHSLKLLDYLY